QRTILRHRDTMLEMSTVAAVGGYGGPLVVEHAGSRLPGIHHRLNRQHHALAQPGAMSADPEIGHLRFLMHAGTNAVSHELSHYAEAVGFDKVLHRSAHIPHGIADASRLDTPVQRSFRDFEQLAHLRRDRIVDRNRDRGVAVVAIQHHAAIDGNNVTGLKHAPFRRDAVNDFLIHRGAKHARIIEVPLECGLCAQLLHPLLGSTLQNHGSHARGHQVAEVIEHVTNDAAAATHLYNLSHRFANTSHSLPTVGGVLH